MGPHLVDERFQGGAGVLDGEEVGAERRLGADRLADAIGEHGPVVDAPGQREVIGAGLPEVLLEEGRRPGSQVSPGEDAEPLHLRPGDGADAVELADRQARHERRPPLRRDDEQAVGLPLVGRDLREELVVGDAGRRGQPGLGADPRPDLLGDRGGRGDPLQVLGDVEIRLVERERLNERRVLGEDRPDLPRDRPIDVEPRLHEDQVGTLPLRADGGHRGADAESPRLIARGGHDAPLARAADRHRLAAKIGIVALLDGGVEGVHVDVDDLALAFRANHVPALDPGDCSDQRPRHSRGVRRESTTRMSTCVQNIRREIPARATARPWGSRVTFLRGGPGDRGPDPTRVD